MPDLKNTFCQTCADDKKKKLTQTTQKEMNKKTSMSRSSMLDFSVSAKYSPVH